MDDSCWEDVPGNLENNLCLFFCVKSLHKIQFFISHNPQKIGIIVKINNPPKQYERVFMVHKGHQLVGKSTDSMNVIFILFQTIQVALSPLSL